MTTVMFQLYVSSTYANNQRSSIAIKSVVFFPTLHGKIFLILHIFSLLPNTSYVKKITQNAVG